MKYSSGVIISNCINIIEVMCIPVTRVTSGSYRSSCHSNIAVQLRQLVQWLVTRTGYLTLDNNPSNMITIVYY